MHVNWEMSLDYCTQILKRVVTLMFWEGIEPCDDENKNKSEENFQFDVSRRISLYA